MFISNIILTAVLKQTKLINGNKHSPFVISPFLGYPYCAFSYFSYFIQQNGLIQMQ